MGRGRDQCRRQIAVLHVVAAAAVEMAVAAGLPPGLPDAARDLGEVRGLVAVSSVIERRDQRPGIGLVPLADGARRVERMAGAGLRWIRDIKIFLIGLFRSARDTSSTAHRQGRRRGGLLCRGRGFPVSVCLSLGGSLT